MIEKRTRTIDGVVYETTTLGARAARAAQIRVVRMLGPSLVKLVGKVDGASLANVDVRDLGPAIQQLVVDVSEEDLDYLCQTFADVSTVKDKGGPVPLAPIFDQHFAGAILRMYRWLAFCVEENYADFFLELGRLRSAAAERVSSSSGSPTESTG